MLMIYIAPPGLDWEYMKLMKAQEFKLEPRDHNLFELIIIVSPLRCLVRILSKHLY
jgi:hypothetical protein